MAVFSYSQVLPQCFLNLSYRGVEGVLQLGNLVDLRSFREPVNANLGIRIPDRLLLSASTKKDFYGFDVSGPVFVIGGGEDREVVLDLITKNDVYAVVPVGIRKDLPNPERSPIQEMAFVKRLYVPARYGLG